MKMRTKIMLSILTLLLLAAAAVYASGRNAAQYPMGGVVTVTGKDHADTGYSITIEQGGVGGQYTLECSKEQFESVEIGDVINCERYQSEITHTGTVYHIREAQIP